MAGSIGDPAVRNRGTLGGNLAANDPASDAAAAALGFGATLQTDRRTIAADAFFTGLFTTALAPAEILTAITFPVSLRAGYARFAHPASRYALVGVFAVLWTGQGGRA